jgi:hypothetical protein
VAEVNELLREHVLRTGFSLVLTKTQIAAMVQLDAAIERGKFVRRDEMAPTWLAFHGTFIGGVQGLERRGLVRHTFHQNKHKYPEYPAQHMPASEAYEITEAGRLVIGLLREAGIYQHYATAMPAQAVASG